MDPAHADLYQRADLEQFQPDAAAAGPGEPGKGQPDAAQRAEQHVGKRGEPQAQLIGPHGGCRGAVSEQVQLAFLDAVLHLATRTVSGSGTTLPWSRPLRTVRASSPRIRLKPQPRC